MPFPEHDPADPRDPFYRTSVTAEENRLSTQEINARLLASELEKYEREQAISERIALLTAMEDGLILGPHDTRFFSNSNPTADAFDHAIEQEIETDAKLGHHPNTE